MEVLSDPKGLGDLWGLQIKLMFEKDRSFFDPLRSIYSLRFVKAFHLVVMLRNM